MSAQMLIPVLSNLQYKTLTAVKADLKITHLFLFLSFFLLSTCFVKSEDLLLFFFTA